MSTPVAIRVAAAVGLLFGALSVVAGSRVLAGIDHPAYVVLTWLVAYNVVAGLAGVVAGVGLWTLRGWAVRAVAVLAALHGLVLIILLAHLALGRPAARDSLGAMVLRTLVWSAIAVVGHRTAR